MFTKNLVQSCCGSMSYIYNLDSPIRKTNLELFTSAGFLAPEHYTRSGIFYVQKQGLTASASFGITRITVKCSGKNCNELIEDIESIFRIL